MVKNNLLLFKYLQKIRIHSFRLQILSMLIFYKCLLFTMQVLTFKLFKFRLLNLYANLKTINVSIYWNIWFFLLSDSIDSINTYIKSFLLNFCRNMILNNTNNSEAFFVNFIIYEPIFNKHVVLHSNRCVKILYV